MRPVVPASLRENLVQPGGLISLHPPGKDFAFPKRRGRLVSLELLEHPKDGARSVARTGRVHVLKPKNEICKDFGLNRDTLAPPRRHESRKRRISPKISRRRACRDSPVRASSPTRTTFPSSHQRSRSSAARMLGIGYRLVKSESPIKACVCKNRLTTMPCDSRSPIELGGNAASYSSRSSARIQRLESATPGISIASARPSCSSSARNVAIGPSSSAVVMSPSSLSRSAISSTVLGGIPWWRSRFSTRPIACGARQSPGTSPRKSGSSEWSLMSEL